MTEESDRPCSAIVFQQIRLTRYGDANRRNARSKEAEFGSSTPCDIDNPSGSVRPAIIDAHMDHSAVSEIFHSDARTER